MNYKKVKKLRNENIDKRLNSRESLCMRYYLNPLLFFFTI